MKTKKLKKMVPFAMVMAMAVSSGLPHVKAETNFTATESVVQFNNDFMIEVTPKTVAQQMKGLSVNGKEMTPADNKFAAWGGNKYFVDKDTGKIYLSEPADGAEIKITLNDETTKILKFTKTEKKGSRITTVENNTTNPKKTENTADSKTEQAAKDTDFSLKDLSTTPGSLTVQITPTEAAAQINKVSIGDKEYTTANSQYTIWNGHDKFYVDTKEGKIYLVEPADGSDIKINLKTGTEKTFKFNKKAGIGNRITNESKKEEPKPVQPEKEKDLELADKHGFGEFMLQLKDPKQADTIKGLQVNHISYDIKPSKWQTFNGGYYVDKATGTVYLNEPKNGDLITIVGEGNKLYHFKYDTSKEKGQRIRVEKDEESIKEKIIKLRLVGEFEAAVVNQKKYDAISGATTSVISNKNSNVKVQFAEVKDTKDTPEDKDWKDLHTNPDLFRNWKDRKVELDSASGMTGVYNTLDSSVTLKGTPEKAGKYQVKVSVTDHNGNKIESNALPFNVYGQNEKLIEHLTLAASKKMDDGKYIYTMEPWLIQEFGGTNETVIVPKEIKAIYGSHKSGTYGEIGKHSDKGAYQTLIVDADTDLTLVNMKVKSSVKILVKKDGKLNLRDSSVYGDIIIEDGGTFSMNHDAYSKKYLTGSSINGRLVLKDGANLDQSMIYSNTNFLTDAGVNGRANKNANPVVDATGNVNILGDVFIKGDEAATGIDPKTNQQYTGQPAIKIENGQLNIPDGVTLAVYGGGKMATTTYGGAAAILNNGEITGGGHLIAVGGSSFLGKGGDAISGNGKISVAKAILQGGNSYGTGSVPGDGYTKEVEISNKTIGKSNNGKFIKIMGDDDQPLYWKEITTPPSIATLDYGDAFINPRKADTWIFEESDKDSVKIADKDEKVVHKGKLTKKESTAKQDDSSKKQDAPVKPNEKTSDTSQKNNSAATDTTTDKSAAIKPAIIKKADINQKKHTVPAKVTKVKNIMTKTNISPKTGDTTSTYVYSGLLLLSGFGIAGMGLKRKRKQ